VRQFIDVPFNSTKKGKEEIMSLMRRADLPVLGGSLLSDFFDDDRFLNSRWLNGRGIPAVNVKETDKKYELEFSAAGYDKNDFKISIDNGLLTVSAEKAEEKERKEGNYTRKEFECGSFSRSFALPTDTKETDISARYEGGVLKLDITKTNGSTDKPRKTIAVK
jgi:HSP20 family protein